MPLYDYDCASCGPFRSWTRLSEADAPAACPHCGALASRAVAMPFLATMDANTRIAHVRNEKSAHEPRVMSREELQASGRKRTELFGGDRHRLGCAHGRSSGRADGRRRPRRSHNTLRPWMIGH